MTTINDGTLTLNENINGTNYVFSIDHDDTVAYARIHADGEFVGCVTFDVDADVISENTITGHVDAVDAAVSIVL